MITCPWCGTHYEQFISNCKNCGGVLPEPSPAQAEIENRPIFETLAPPPPAPRQVSDSYALKLLSSDGAGIAGFVLALIGAIFGIVGIALTLGVITAFVGIPFALLGGVMFIAGAGLLIWRYQEKFKIVTVIRSGQAAQGEIVDLSENLMVEINNRHPWNIQYRFQVMGQSFEGSVTTLKTPGWQFQPGQAVYVLYMPDTPTQNALYPHP